MPQSPLVIVPANADVDAGAVCLFKVEPAGTAVAWRLSPQVGKIDAEGIYTAPVPVTQPQTVIVTAVAKSGESAIASIELVDNPARIRFLARYAMIVSLLLITGIGISWDHLDGAARPTVVIVNPAAVTLDPATDARFPFEAIVPGDAKHKFNWSVDDGGVVDGQGVFTPKLDKTAGIDRALRLTARSTTNPNLTGTAMIRLVSGVRFEIVPSVTAVAASQQVAFRTPNGGSQWSVSRTDIATISKPDGLFTAGTPGPKPGLVTVSAWGKTATERAAVTLVIMPLFRGTGSSGWSALLFAMLCGALGSMVYYTFSFVSYVGNRTFRSSWFWFYISKPFVGAVLALIFYFIGGSGVISGTESADIMKVGMISALVGLFSDKAVKKLSDVMDVLLATKDDRKDKVKDETPVPPPGGTGTATLRPVIKAAAPATLQKGVAATVEIQGSNFDQPGFQVTVNGAADATVKPAAAKFSVAVSAAQAVPPGVVIAVTTDQGPAEVELPVA